MPGDSKAVYIILEELTWATEIFATGGGGIQSVPTEHPFLWTIFFKMDDDNLKAPNLVTCFFTDGDHRDLEVADIHPLQTIAIPEDIGMNSMNVKPLKASFTQQGLSSIFGVIAILMRDGGHITANGIRAGHNALNQGVQELLDSIVGDAFATMSVPTQAQVEAAVEASDLSGRVANAIEDAQSFCENLWSLSGKDSQIGHVVLQLSLADFPNPSETREFDMEIPVNGGAEVWKIKASVTVVDACPASAGAETLHRVFNDIPLAGATSAEEMKPGTWDARQVLDLMRQYRDKKQLLRHSKFSDWWELIKTYAPELACRLGTDKNVAVRMKPIVESLASHLKDDKLKISRKTILEAVEVLELLQQKSSCRLRKELQASRLLIRRFENYTLEEALDALATRRLKKDVLTGKTGG